MEIITRGEKRKKYMREYQLAHKDKIREYLKEYYHTHKEHHKKQRRIWYCANREQIIEKANIYQITHPETRRRIHRKWAATHREKINEWAREYADRYPEKINEHSRRRRARKKNAKGNGVTDKQWQKIQKEYGYLCAYCNQKKPLEMDHIIPLSGGGRHEIENIVPACKSCNSSKNNSSLLTFLLRHCGDKNIFNPV